MINTVLAVTLAAVSLIDANVQRVNDRRSPGPFAQLELVLELPKIKDADVAASRVTVQAATDETGGDLVDHDHEPMLNENFRGRASDGSTPATISVTLKNPARAATKVTEVRGEIELYMPSKDPNSVAEVPKFLSFSGKPIAHKALKANGVEIALISKAQLDAEKKKMADAKRKGYAADGYEGESLDQMMSSYLESLLTLEASDLVVRVKDPNKRIQDIAYVDAAGEVKRVTTRDEEGLTRLSTWGEVPQPDWKLRVNMITAKNMVKHAFVVKDVPLP
jgi:hypothetical protein